jgi:CO/xanthine dehydrogenase FAD-binding subunit
LKPEKFEYDATPSTAEALELLGRPGVEAKIAAGDQSLIPPLNLRLAAPEHLIDIMRISESGERQCSNGMIPRQDQKRERQGPHAV